MIRNIYCILKIFFRYKESCIQFKEHDSFPVQETLHYKVLLSRTNTYGLPFSSAVALDLDGLCEKNKKCNRIDCIVATFQSFSTVRIFHLVSPKLKNNASLANKSFDVFCINIKLTSKADIQFHYIIKKPFNIQKHMTVVVSLLHI